LDYSLHGTKKIYKAMFGLSEGAIVEWLKTATCMLQLGGGLSEMGA
jgi:hypothetical protein